MDNKTRLIKILMDINPDYDYEKETSLVDNGIFDSLEIMTIVTEIDSHFHVEIDPDDVVAENFNSIEKMLQLIEKNRDEETMI